MKTFSSRTLSKHKYRLAFELAHFVQTYARAFMHTRANDVCTRNIIVPETPATSYILCARICFKPMYPLACVSVSES